MTVAFISGHLDLTEDEFIAHYIRLIDRAIIHKHSFVVGDAPGADTLAQRYLAYVHQWSPGQLPVTVYHAFDKPRNNAGDYPTRGGFTSQTAKDKAMTLASDYDICWVRPGREDSGTARNIERRRKLNDK